VTAETFFYGIIWNSTQTELVINTRDASDTDYIIPLGGNDASKVSLVSMESFGDGTGRIRAIYDGAEKTTPTFQINNVTQGIFYTGLIPTDLDQSIGVNLHSDTSQWVMTYPANAQDLCGNTK
jgi:hypothetical protein